ncbi:DUF551 domain-containing protein [Microvirga arsenatis]|uniref:DUF551 domain-containing protein n=1 Tax=Microvirga arsenatis TaxID=2692265 RepID=A0ABW9YUL8_9HYPH|nr:DUF551 domain-containing protein [Microvirga arsenatis]NBJ13299.1 hypothetical protein [Microvirga arsenatis]NBJ24083.1 hypothetical protein [Microvirga arsenatis]
MSTKLREKIARIIDLDAHSSWQRLYDLCLRDGDDETKAREIADFGYGKSVRASQEKADAILAALAAEGQGREGWQDISTAPKDGRAEIIGIDGCGRVYKTWFFAPSGRTQQWLRAHDSVPWHPTHWMPLPAPPPVSGEGSLCPPSGQGPHRESSSSVEASRQVAPPEGGANG